MRSAEMIMVTEYAPLREVLAVIDRGAMEIAIVVDAAQHLIGTVTDGDIRRAILRGLQLDASADQVMNRHFTAVGAEAAQKEVMTLMHTRSLKQIPVLDGKVR